MVSGSGTGDRASSRIPRPATRRKFWGWGLEGQGLTTSEIEQLGAAFSSRFGIDGVRVREPPQVGELDLRAPRLAPPAPLEAAFSTDPYDRAAHTYGRSFRDLVRAFRRDYAHAPDLVAFPRGEGELGSVLEWCSEAGVAAIPFGGGSAWSAVSSPMWVTATAASSAWTLVTLPGCWRWTAPRGPRGSRVARWGRWWRRS